VLKSKWFREHYPSVRTDFTLYNILILEQKFRSDDSI